MKGEAFRDSSLGGGEETKKLYVWRGRGRARVEGFSGAVRAHSAKICLMHSLNLGACAGFSQGYRRGL